MFRTCVQSPSITLTNSINTTPAISIEGFSTAVLITGNISSTAVGIHVSLDGVTYKEIVTVSPFTIGDDKAYTLPSVAGYKFMKLVTNQNDASVPFGIGLIS